MGTKVQCKSCFGGYNPMRDLNDDVNGNSWPHFCGERNIQNYTGFIPRTAADVYTGYDKNELKQKMLEHEAVFKNQVYELHRLYKIQKDMMEEIHTQDWSRHRRSIEPSTSSSIQGSQVEGDDIRKWHHGTYPLGDPYYNRSAVNSPLSYKKGNITFASRVASQNGFPKELQVSEARPSKVRKKLFDLQLSADEYVDTEDEEQLDKNVHAEPSSVSHFKRSTGLADLNEPILIEEVTESSTHNIFRHSVCNGGAKDVHLSKEAMHKSNDAGTWPQLMQSLGKPNLTSFHTHPSLGSSVFSNHISGDKWHVSSSRLNPYVASDFPSHNGFYQGSSSGSKDRAFTSSSCVDIKPLKDINLNAAFGSADANCISFPWLKTKPRREVIYIDASPPRASPSKAVIDLNQVYNDSSSSNNHTTSKNETNPTPIVKKILGVPIFEKRLVSENDAKHERKNILIDINVACDEEPETNEVIGESPCARNFIDLNTWMAEDEDPSVPSVASISGPKKAVVEIDLEAPAVPEEEQEIMPLPPDNDTEQAEDEAIKSAAEAIVNMSSFQQMNQEEEELLLWFANVVSTPPMFGKECSYKVMDDYEAMALQLPETKEEDFMPKPFVPEVQNKAEEAGTSTASLPGRPRRGQARRGRQRRDFQRDILPGLVSLSRHELTEDLHTFGGLMKAMGHSWNSGLTKRNGGGRNKTARGRRRTVVEAAPVASTQVMQQMDNNVEASLEDTSLTGWGKTTRRPRRQRCPAGNAATVTLT